MTLKRPTNRSQMNKGNCLRSDMCNVIVTKVQETQRVPNRINPRQNTPRHILIKLIKIKHKEQILKAAREKK